MPVNPLPGRRALAREARLGFPNLRPARRPLVAARAALARLLWRADGHRLAPSNRALDRALHALPVGELEWFFELNPLGPLYFLPTREWVRAFVKQLDALGVTRVLEVAAGDGFLSHSLRIAAPHLEFIATDSGAWERPEARMNAAERKRFAKTEVPGLALGEGVLRREARRAIRTFAPDLVLAAWLPPGPLLDSLIRAQVRYVVDVGAAGGVTSSAWSWRFAHDFLDGPLETLARCRLDARPARELHSRLTLYFGAAHEEHAVERVREGDWLWQYRPAPRK
jgi:hypothetical protein